MSEKLTNFLNPVCIYLISLKQYAQAKLNRDILHAIRIIQVQSNRYIHEFKKKLFVHMINEG